VYKTNEIKQKQINKKQKNSTDSYKFLVLVMKHLSTIFVLVKQPIRTLYLINNVLKLRGSTRTSIFHDLRHGIESL